MLFFVYIFLINILSANVSHDISGLNETTEKIHIQDKEYSIIITGNYQVGISKIIPAIENAIKYNPAHMRQNIIDQLMNTEHFESVEVTIDDTIMRVHVVENPFIRQIKYDGMKIEQMLQGTNISDITGINEYHLVSTAVIEAGITKLTNLLFSQTGMAIQATYAINDQSDLIITLNPTYNALVTELEFVNNKQFTTNALLSSLPMYSIFSGLSISGVLLQHAVVPHIIKKYKDEGFLDCKIDSIKLIPIDNLGNSKAIIFINEGEKYVIENCILNISKEIDQSYLTKAIEIFNTYRAKDNNTKWEYYKDFLENLSKELVSKADFFFIDHQIKKQNNNKADLILGIKQKVICINKIHIKTCTLNQKAVLRILKIHPGQHTSEYYLKAACITASHGMPCIKNITFELESISDDSNLYDLILTVEEEKTFKCNPLSTGIVRRPGAAHKSIFSWNPFELGRNAFNTYTLHYNPAFKWKNFMGHGHSCEFSVGRDLNEIDHIDFQFSYAINRVNTWDNIGKKFTYIKTVSKSRFTGSTRINHEASTGNTEELSYADRLYKLFYTSNNITVDELAKSPLISVLTTKYSIIQISIDFLFNNLLIDTGVKLTVSKNTSLLYTVTNYDAQETNVTAIKAAIDKSSLYNYDFIKNEKKSITKRSADISIADHIGMIDKQIQDLSNENLMISKNILLADIEWFAETTYSRAVYHQALRYIPQIYISPFSFKTMHQLTFVSYRGKNARIVYGASAGRIWLHDLGAVVAKTIGSYLKSEDQTTEAYSEALKQHTINSHTFKTNYGPYHKTLDALIGGQNIFTLEFMYVSKWKQLSEMIIFLSDLDFFIGIKSGSCWGHHINSNNIINKNFRLRTNLMLGIIITLPYLGRMQLTITVPLTNVKIFGYDIGYDTRYDIMQFISFSPAD